MRSIYRQQLFRSLTARQGSSDQVKILKYQIAQTTTRVVGVAYRLFLPFSINRVLIYIYMSVTKTSNEDEDTYLLFFIIQNLFKINSKNTKLTLFPYFHIINYYLLWYSLQMCFHLHQENNFQNFKSYLLTKIYRMQNIEYIKYIECRITYFKCFKYPGHKNTS